MTEFVVDDQFEGDYFDARFFYDVKDLDSKKIVTSIAHEPEEMEKGGFKMTIQLPFGYEGIDEISDVTIQRREKPSDPDKQDWPIDVSETETRKGYLDKSLFEKRVDNKGQAEFYDYFGFKAETTYQYRAIVQANNYADKYDIPLGEVKATKNGWDYPTFKNNVKPVFSWNSTTETLSITNAPELAPSSAMLTEWGSGKKWEWGLSLIYKDADNTQGLWPWVVVKAEDVLWGEPFKSYTVEAKDGLGSTYTLNAVEYYLELYIQDQGVSQIIVLNPSDLGAAATLTK